MYLVYGILKTPDCGVAGVCTNLVGADIAMVK